MWILRWHLIQSRDYNKITRICLRIGVCPKSHSPLIIMKGLIIHLLQQKSWRIVARELGVPHVQLFYFSQKIESRQEIIAEMLGYFADRGIIVYAGNRIHISEEWLISDESRDQTSREITRMMRQTETKAKKDRG